MRRVPVTVGESTSCVADDDPITVVALSRRETKYGTHAVACALGVLQPLGELQMQGAHLPNLSFKPTGFFRVGCQLRCQPRCKSGGLTQALGTVSKLYLQVRSDLIAL
jgi:hypothetical protein